MNNGWLLTIIDEVKSYFNFRKIIIEDVFHFLFLQPL